MANDHSKLPKRVMANERSQLSKHNNNNNKNKRLSVGLDLYLTLGHKVNDRSGIISNCCILLYCNSRVEIK